MLSQGLEIQANTSSRASLLAHRLEEQHPPSLSSWPPASVLQGKPLQKGIVGAEGFSGVSPGEMLGTSCPVSPREGLTCKAVPSLMLRPNFSTFLKSRFVPTILVLDFVPLQQGTAQNILSTSAWGDFQRSLLSWTKNAIK